MEKTEFLFKLGENIKFHRKRKDISQAELARLLFKDRQSVERIENGKVNTSIFQLFEISKALEVDLSELIINLK